MDGLHLISRNPEGYHHYPAGTFRALTAEPDRIQVQTESSYGCAVRRIRTHASIPQFSGIKPVDPRCFAARFFHEMLRAAWAVATLAIP
jgi:hypothetical protein